MASFFAWPQYVNAWISWLRQWIDFLRHYDRTILSVLHHTCRWCRRLCQCHDDVIKRKDFSRYWPFVWGIHRSPVNSPHKGQWRGNLMFSMICASINGSINNREAGDLRRHRAHYDVIVMATQQTAPVAISHVICTIIVIKNGFNAILYKT